MQLNAHKLIIFDHNHGSQTRDQYPALKFQWATMKGADERAHIDDEKFIALKMSTV